MWYHLLLQHGTSLSRYFHKALLMGGVILFTSQLVETKAKLVKESQESGSTLSPQDFTYARPLVGMLTDVSTLKAWSCMNILKLKSFKISFGIIDIDIQFPLLVNEYLLPSIQERDFSQMYKSFDQILGILLPMLLSRILSTATLNTVRKIKSLISLPKVLLLPIKLWS